MEIGIITTNICRQCLELIGNKIFDLKPGFFGECDLCFEKPRNCQHFELNIADESAELKEMPNES